MTTHAWEQTSSVHSERLYGSVSPTFTACVGYSDTPDWFSPSAASRVHWKYTGARRDSDAFSCHQHRLTSIQACNTQSRRDGLPASSVYTAFLPIK